MNADSTPKHKQLHRFRATVFASEFYEADILAISDDDAWDIASDTDGGSFTSTEEVEWEIIKVVPVSDDETFNPVNV